jgi:threonine dehydratase
LPMLRGKRVALLVSGGNIDVNLLSRIIGRGLAKSGRTMHVRVLVQDIPGTLASLLAEIARAGANVLAVQHDRMAPNASYGGAAVDVTLETRGFDHVQAVQGALLAAGFRLDVD